MDFSREFGHGSWRYRRFSEEFKRDAVRLVSEEKYTFKAAAAAVNVSEQSLRAWHAKYAPAPEPCGEDAMVGELRDEVKRLRQQLQRAELEHDILPLDRSTPHLPIALHFWAKALDLRGVRRSWLIC